MDSQDLYDIYFKGEILEGFLEADVRASLQALFKAPASKIDQMFCGKAVIIKKDVDKTTALKYQTALKKAGAKPLINAKPQSAGSDANSNHSSATANAISQTAPQAQAQAQAQHSKPQQTPPPEPNQPTQKTSLAERLAALDEEFSQQAHNKPAKPAVAQKQATQTLSNASPHAQSKADSAAIAQPTGLNLLPVGADMLTSDEREVIEPIEVDISGISLANVGARIGEESHEPEPPAPDTDYLSVAETGSDMNPDKPAELPLPEFDLSDMSVAETGAQLVEPSAEPLPPAMDLSNMTLADVGTRLAEESDEPKAKAPDVSHIHLAD